MKKPIFLLTNSGHGGMVRDNTPDKQQLANILEFDQLIYEFVDDNNPEWVR